MLTLESRVTRNNAVLFTPVDGEIVAMNIDCANYYNFDGIGAFIWNMLETENSISDICDALLCKYDAPRDVIQRDILALLEDMKKNDLLSP